MMMMMMSKPLLARATTASSSTTSIGGISVRGCSRCMASMMIMDDTAGSTLTPWRRKSDFRTTRTASHYFSSTRRQLTNASERHHSSTSSSSRARHVLMLREFQRHGYKLANINPLEPTGFLADDNAIRESLPSTMQPLVNAIAQCRRQSATTMNEDKNCSSSTSSKDFAQAVTARLMKQGNGNHSGVVMDAKEITDLELCLEKYCATGIGFDIDHCHTEQERLFFSNILAPSNNNNNDEQGQLADLSSLLWTYEQLLRTSSFAKFMSERYPTTRRFGIEGLEAAVPALNTIVNAFGDCPRDDNNSAVHRHHHEPKRVVLGTLHRGRLDFLAHVLQIPLQELVQKWDVTEGPTYDDICSGHHSDVTTTAASGSGNNDDDNNTVHISLLPVPAHLEAMDAVVSGKARAHAVALQSHNKSTVGGSKDDDDDIIIWDDAAARRQVLPVTIHGDSSVCGQGIVSETLQLGTCQHYECGGAIRLILDNQVGFTTEASKIRNHSKHGMTQVSDVAKSVGAPILHVNARIADDVVRAARIAVDYRQTFGKDIFLHLWGWREHGHNELDDPHPTNVELYQNVESQVPVTESFRERLLRQGSENSSITETMLANIKAKVETEFAQAKAIARGPSWKSSAPAISTEGAIKRSLRPKKIIRGTTVDQQLWDEAASRLVNVPNGFRLHPFVEKVVESRKRALFADNAGSRVDWATAELLALMTLALEGINCRLSGEDVERGTFFQRHGVWHDIETGKEYHPLFPVEICNSPLSEFGVLSFEYGYSVARPADSLVLWEAQFGDFANGAQAILDAVLSSSDEKWGMQSGLTLLLPHGYDGMGPEHSSARLERWLQLFSSHLNRPAADNDEQSKYESANMSVTYPTSPANYFHLLRRQLTWSFRRPLVVLTPKRTLRMAAATSDKSEFLFNAFQAVLDDPRMSQSATASRLKENIRAVLLCSGELYYDLIQLREESRLSSNVAIVRLEELAPFPSDELGNILSQYSNARSIAWVQEEPANQGARDFLLKHMQSSPLAECLVKPNDITVTCLSRPEAAAPAVGTPQGHHVSQAKLLEDVTTWSEEVCS